MDLKINNISFQGKSEILYGLKRAAAISRTAALAENNYIQSRLCMTKFEQRTAYDAALRAYFDMVTIDEEFANSVNNFNSEELKYVKKELSPIETDSGVVTPFDIFRKTLLGVMKENKTIEKTENKGILGILFDKLNS